MAPERRATSTSSRKSSQKSSPSSQTTTTSSATSNSTPTRSNPNIAPKLKWSNRLRVTIKFYIVQYAFKLLFIVYRISGTQLKSHRPDFVKGYDVPGWEGLRHRFFVPKVNGKDGNEREERKKFPLYINIHGGGFALMEPMIDDRHNSYFRDQHNILVVSLAYPLTPKHIFPTAIDVLTSFILAVLSDSSLPIDHERIIIGGASAGGNLAFAVCQDERLRGFLKAVVALYPVIDFTAENDALRVECFEKAGKVVVGKGRGGVGCPLDAIRDLGALYVPEGEDLRDCRLSVKFAGREKFPGRVCVVGVEGCGLCGEGERFVRGLVGGGRRVDGNREEHNWGDVWEKEGVRWEMVRGEDHGFDGMPGWGEDKRRREARGLKMRADIAEWLFREVFV